MEQIVTFESKTKFSLLTGSLVLLSATLLLFSYSPETLSTSTLAGIAAFVVLAILAEGFPLKVPFGNAFLSLSGTIFWALLILFDPFWATLTGFLSLTASEFIIKKRSVIKGIFNTCQTSISVFAGSSIFVYIMGGPGLSSDLIFFGAFATAALVHWCVNTWLVSVGAHVLYGESIYRFWTKNFKWAFVYEITSAPMALIVAFAYDQLALVGLLLVTLPMLMVRIAYSQYLELKKTYHETVRTLVKIIEMHDPYTAGHSDRVAIYARRLCEALRLAPSLTEKVELAAYLHDLGKINLDLTNIVQKKGKLTEDEKRLIKLHSIVSADLANQVSYFRGEIEAMIRHHHENWDGTGYPHGLKGEEIPLGARIILLADAFDAMSSNRVYRTALDLETVKDEFKKFAGIQFDPGLVPMFVSNVIGDGSKILRQPLDQPLLEGSRRTDERELRLHGIRKVMG